MMKIILTLLVLASVVACQPKTDAAKAAAPGAATPASSAAGSGPGSAVAGSTGMLPPGHMKIAPVPADLEEIKVAKASGPNARTVAEVVTKRNELQNKTVVVRGKVVKFNPRILKKNWIHLRDGSGLVSDNTNDVLVTTLDEAKVGDVVVVTGVVAVDRDLGMGYSYRVVIEQATLQK